MFVVTGTAALAHPHHPLPYFQQYLCTRSEYLPYLLAGSGPRQAPLVLSVVYSCSKNGASLSDRKAGQSRGKGELLSNSNDSCQGPCQASRTTEMLGSESALLKPTCEDEVLETQKDHDRCMAVMAGRTSLASN